MNTLINLQLLNVIWFSMKKLLLLLCIKALIYVLKSSGEYNIDITYCKLGFYSRIKINVLIASKLLDPLCLRKYVFHCQQFFPQSGNFPTIKKFFHTVKELFQSKAIFAQSRNVSLVKTFFRNQIIFPWSRHVSTAKEIFHKKFLQTKKLSAKLFFLI